MNDPFEDQLGHSLQRHAQDATSRRDLTADAIDQARRIRARRRTTTAVAGLVLVAAMVPVTLNLTGGTSDRTELDYAQPSPKATDTGSEATRRERTERVRTPEPTEDEPPTPDIGPTTPGDEPTEGADPSEPPTKDVSVEIDFGALPQGLGPAVPYYDNTASTIVDGDSRLVAAELSGVSDVSRISGGYAVQTLGERSELALVEPSGDTRPLSENGDIETYATSLDGERIAWVEGDSAVSERVLVMADGNGEVVGDLPGGAMQVAGFLQNGRVAVGSDLEETAFIWDPATNQTEPLDETTDAVATDGVGYLSVITGEDEEFRACSSLLDTGNGNQELWGGCERLIRVLSPGGNYAVTVDPRSDGMGDVAFEIVDGPTGARSVEAVGTDEDDPTYFDYAFESAGVVLIDAADSGQRAIIRCVANGECEFATEPQPYDLDELGEPPYVLGK